jgi:CRP/FNR family transcriptional regulator, cyclic AMP receptor protein
VAAGLVIIAFCMRDIISLRVMALISNVAFLIYGFGLGLIPVWLLHMVCRCSKVYLAPELVRQ